MAVPRSFIMCRPFCRTLNHVLALAIFVAAPAVTPAQQSSQLLLTLPDYCPTPDGMAIDPDGNLVVACPNFADPKQPGCLIKIDSRLGVRKWADVPPLAETGHAYPMGIAFGPDGDLFVCDNQNWPTGNGKQGELNQGRLLRLRIRDGRAEKTTVVAGQISHPNGVRVRDGQVYLTVSMLPKVKRPDGLLTSAVYRFAVDDHDITLANTLDDPNLLVSLVTQNRDCQYGADGLAFDSHGNLFVGNFGDGALHKMTFNRQGQVTSNTVFAKTDMATPMSDPAFKTKMVQAKMRTTDGIFIDPSDNVYVADFSNNAVCRVDPKGNIVVLAQSADCKGSGGGLDQPGEPILWNGRLVMSCFDMVTGPDKVNTRHEPPAAMVWLKIDR
jgi:sugar lactone lactonase YvrE